MPESLKDVAVQGLMETGKNTWDNEVLADISDERDSDLIKNIPLPMRERQDSWFWLLDEKGCFTLRVAIEVRRVSSILLTQVFRENY